MTHTISAWIYIVFPLLIHMKMISFCIHAYRNIVIKIQPRVYTKKLYWEARTTTTLSIAPSSVPSVEINFMSQALVVTFEQKITPLKPIWQHITVTPQWASIVSNYWQSDRLFNRLSRLIQKINPRCWLSVWGIHRWPMVPLTKRKPSTFDFIRGIPLTKKQNSVRSLSM